MSKHTPGPWTVEDTGHYVVGPDGLSVADYERGRPEDDANARLIAAAPDLLAVLKMLRGIDDAYGFDLDEAQRDWMHDAIRKAEG